MEAPVRASDNLSALTSIMSNVERKTEQRKQNEFNERIQEIQVNFTWQRVILDCTSDINLVHKGRISSHLEQYEEDRKNFDKQIAKKVQARTKYVDIGLRFPILKGPSPKNEGHVRDLR